MRNGGIVVSIFLVGLLGTAKVTAASGGIAVTPATAILELQQGQQQASTTITITNTYASAVALDFSVSTTSFNPEDRPLTNNQLQQMIHFTEPDVELGSGQSITQQIVLRDSPQLPPGSTAITVDITQRYSQSKAIAITPAIHIPVVLLKDSGALSSLQIERVKTPGIPWTMPHNADYAFKNTGNTIAIPRGSVTIQDAHNRIVSSGVINESSLAVLPSKRLQTATTLHSESRWPTTGIYTMDIAYRMSGQNTISYQHIRFLYVAWWQAVGLAGILAGVFFAVKTWWPKVRNRLHKKPAPAKPKRVKLIGRDIT